MHKYGCNARGVTTRVVLVGLMHNYGCNARVITAGGDEAEGGHVDLSGGVGEGGRWLMLMT